MCEVKCEVKCEVRSVWCELKLRHEKGGGGGRCVIGEHPCSASSKRAELRSCFCSYS